MTTRRIMNEIKELNEYIASEQLIINRIVDLRMDEDNLYSLEITFLGPDETPYEEIINNLQIKIPHDYPHKPPNMKFTTKLYHPNISVDGDICLDILKNNWKPVYTLRTLLLSIMSLLSDPNPESPLNGDAAIMYENSKTSLNARRKFARKILQFSRQDPA